MIKPPVKPGRVAIGPSGFEMANVQRYFNYPLPGIQQPGSPRPPHSSGDAKVNRTLVQVGLPAYWRKSALAGVTPLEINRSAII
jgi:hypothetical protein